MPAMLSRGVTGRHRAHGALLREGEGIRTLP